MDIEWECQICTYININTNRCEMCLTIKDSTESNIDNLTCINVKQKVEEYEHKINNNYKDSLIADTVPLIADPVPENSNTDSDCNCDSCMGLYINLSKLQECKHTVCYSCLRNTLITSLHSNTCFTTLCPVLNCDCIIDFNLNYSNIKKCLSKDELLNYDNQVLEHFFQSNSDIGNFLLLECPNEKCKFKIEFNEISEIKVPEIINDLDNNGKPLTIEGYKHFASYRIRCRNCNTNFCAKCKTVPYHLNKTCELYEDYIQSRHCRFCKEKLENNIDIEVCDQDECAEKYKKVCKTTLECGHSCCGLVSEKSHLPCLVGCDQKQFTTDDLCQICWVDSLDSAPCILLNCGHIFHYQCTVEKIEKGFPGSRITFNYLNCPLCKKLMEHISLEEIFSKPLQLYEDVKQKSLDRIKLEKLDTSPKISNPPFNGDKLSFAFASLAFYVCFKCKKPFFGGLRNCEQNAEAENRPRDEFVCFDCAELKVVSCSDPSHREYYVFKCRFCCSIASWFCWGIFKS